MTALWDFLLALPFYCAAYVIFKNAKRTTFWWLMLVLAMALGVKVQI